MRKLILFNGPPRCGKDTAALHLYTRLNVHWFRMSQPLKDAVRHIWRMTGAQYEEHEDKKDAPSQLLFGKTFREVQISMSEDWLKRLYGDDVFGRLARRVCERSVSRIAVCSDSGFVEEVAPLVDLFGPSNVLLVRLHRIGCNFSNDSRSYLDLPLVKAIDLQNNGSKAVFHETLDALVDAWIGDSK